MYKTISVRAKFTEEEKVFWVDQCEHANSLINCAVYHIRQNHYAQLEQHGLAFTTYWRGDELRYGWKTYKCQTSYPELDKVLKLWIDWVIDDGKEPIDTNPNLDYSQAWSFDHGGTNWFTGVSTCGKSLIIDGRKLKSMNQGYCRLVAKCKQGKSDFYWDSNLERVQRKCNNQMRDAVNKAARFIINQCLNDRVGNLVIGWNERQKHGSGMGKRNNQNFVVIPTKRLIERLKQLACEYRCVTTF